MTAGGQGLAFRQATIERADIIQSESIVQTTSTQRVERVVEGAGYIYAIWMQIVAVTAGNAAAVALSEDAPWNVLDTVVFRDVNGEVLNVQGFDLYLANLIDHQGTAFYDGSGGGGLTDPNVYAAPVVGAGATGGSFTTALRVPLGTNRRDLVGILGNQDRAQKYLLRDDIAPTTTVYSTVPTTAPTLNITRIYENYAVPLPQSPSGQPQQVFPPSFGTIHYLTATVSEAAPIGGATLNHYLRRVGYTVRWVALVFRSNGSRATAEANAPTSIRLKLGEDTIFNETYAYRRALMYERYGFSFPKGVLVYEAMHDMMPEAGGELGDDYFHTQSLVNAQFIVAYPSGFGSTNNTLKIVTDDLQLAAMQ